MASAISLPDCPGGGVVPATVDSPVFPPHPLVATSKPSKPTAIDARFMWSTRTIRMRISFILIDNGNNAAGIVLPRYDSSKTCSKRELRAAVFSYAPPVADCENSQENDTVVTQTAQHELIKDHEAHEPAVNLPHTAIRPDGNSTRSLTSLAKNCTRARSLLAAFVEAKRMRSDR
jgi:hypothetical protein